MPSFPFESESQELRAVMRKAYIKQLATWLLGTRPGRILAQESGSNWESAMTLEFFIEVANIYREQNEERQLCENLESICPKVCQWLLSNRVPLEGPCSWEKVTWDTAVVIRVILMCVERLPWQFSDEWKNEIYEVANQAIEWLNSRFRAWEQDVKYPFGPADVAQILITGLYVKRHFPLLFAKQKKLLEQLHKDIIGYLLVKASETIDIRLENGELVQVAWWGDYFQTAEVIEALAVYYDDIGSQKHEQDDHLRAKMEKVLFDAMIVIERTQQDGMWGTHVDTMRTLYSYIRVCALVPKISCKPHLTFKALRWICDEKQRFSDGSFLHTMFLTIFMAPAFVAVHNNWSLARKSVIEVYDEALWASPVQCGVDRIRCFEAETRVSDLRDDLGSVKQKLSSITKLLLSLLLTVLMFVLVFWLGWWNKLWGIKISAKAEDLLKILPMVLAGYTAIMIAIWRK